ncbi:hypothetical protein CANARDRAFT_5450 [[Candida] arabinofermentans NRRL YB-2248]|uniref:DUF1279 domain-containing protein n=1 Tax=[Candida] arabinofermentans NRRL YB-2248 TaxID=983967 RepID=A0A1E4T8S6_9ASCO|nr:hypothetical protein CANARDRAFT_5450 [[Candida] arabinofermentans NRRL YB-2248]
MFLSRTTTVTTLKFIGGNLGLINHTAHRTIVTGNASFFSKFHPVSYRSLFKDVIARTRRFNSTRAPIPSPTEKKPTGIKLLIQEYGYSALGIYLGLSCIDLPICFLLVHSAGEDKIKELQDKALYWFGLDKWAFKKKQSDSDPDSDSDSSEGIVTSTLWTEFAVAYAIHKSLIFIRLPITAAITPAVVGKLRSLGFNVGKFTSAAKHSVGQEGLKGTLTKDGIRGMAKNMSHTQDFGKPASKTQRWFFF